MSSLNTFTSCTLVSGSVKKLRIVNSEASALFTSSRGTTASKACAMHSMSDDSLRIPPSVSRNVRNTLLLSLATANRRPTYVVASCEAPGTHELHGACDGSGRRNTPPTASEQAGQAQYAQ